MHHAVAGFWTELLCDGKISIRIEETNSYERIGLYVISIRRKASRATPETNIIPSSLTGPQLVYS